MWLKFLKLLRTSSNSVISYYSLCKGEGNALWCTADDSKC